ncbi:hypothetical protein CLV35_0350 [Motilibacter peucedani]|uniref:NlpC/P60 family protein n=1 Tax=Motilibacter peucedani TaxID=598650 RepID=A0A420XSX9_9ACTN|nr:hypothetical protein [Motilibacter peucedani]RKS79933.1 hypothetical protein CLV35_0350 [Motilibacter peucedani]
MSSRLVSAVAAALVTVLALLTVVVVTSVDAAAVACLPPGVAVIGTVPPDLQLDSAQAADATAVVRAVVSRRLPSRAAVVALAAALQESGLRNLASQAVPESLTYPHDAVAAGDADSVGLFQQRAGWGTVAQRMDVGYAAGAFLDRLARVDGWPALPVTDAAQAVQVSATPDAYARWQTEATRIVNGLLGRPDQPGDGQAGVADAPGLLAEGEGLLLQLADHLPATYLGGAVVTTAARGRTTPSGIADLQSRSVDLPGSLLVTLGGSDAPTSAAAATAEVNAVLSLAGDRRSTYWLTTPTNRELTAALRAAAAAHAQLQLVDVATAVQARPDWMAAGRYTAAGLTGISTMVLTALGADIAGDPTRTADLGGDGCSDGLGGYSTVPVADCTFTLAHPPPRSCADAIRWALAQEDGPAQWHRRCLNFVARAYGLAHSGVGAPYTARQFWLESHSQHPGDLNPPAGALVFWDGGLAGHVALSAGDRQVISTDIGGAGTVSEVPLDQITSAWHDPYLGWTDPEFAVSA